MKTARLKMLNGEKLSECRRCFEIESVGGESQRIAHNRRFAHHFPIVDTTNEDGSLDKINMPYMDIRFSNICNLRCRTCGPELSSGWFGDAKKLGNQKIIAIDTPTTNPDILWSYLDELLDTVEIIYFAGGEPLMTKEHYRILNHLISRGKTSVQLEYNTNFTVTQFKDESIFELWNKFDNVLVGASLDAAGSKLEYLRKGIQWGEIKSNRELLLEHCPRVRFYVNYTLSIFNMLDMPAFHKQCVDLGFIEISDFNINILTNPAYYSTNIATENMKRIAYTLYHDHIEWINKNAAGKNIIRVVECWNSALQLLSQPSDVSSRIQFAKTTRKLDEIRGESLIAIFPELKELYE